jgi:hypothetical protein
VAEDLLQLLDGAARHHSLACGGVESEPPPGPSPLEEGAALDHGDARNRDRKERPAHGGYLGASV